MSFQATAMRLPLLVGEVNPYGPDPDYALFPDPVGSAGWRLCHRVLGLTERDYLRKFERVNLCDHVWSLPVARRAATHLASQRFRAIILLGTRVSQAFRVPYRPFTRIAPVLGRPELIILPHPSGRCFLWNDPGSFERARGLVGGVASCSS